MTHCIIFVHKAKVTHPSHRYSTYNYHSLYYSHTIPLLFHTYTPIDCNIYSSYTVLIQFYTHCTPESQYGSLYSSLMILVTIHYALCTLRADILFYGSIYDSMYSSIPFYVFMDGWMHGLMDGSTTHIIIINTPRKKKWIIPTCMQGLSTMIFPCNTTGGCLKAMLYLNDVSFDA